MEKINASPAATKRMAVKLGSVSKLVFPWAKRDQSICRKIIPTARKSLRVKVKDIQKVLPGSTQAEVSKWFSMKASVTYSSIRFPFFVVSDSQMSPCVPLRQDRPHATSSNA